MNVFSVTKNDVAKKTVIFQTMIWTKMDMLFEDFKKK